MKIKKVIRTLSQENAAKADILQKRIAQEPLNPKLYLELGELYEQDQLVNESLAEYQKAVALDASNSRALLKTGCAYLLLADVAKATEALQKSLQLNPKSLEAKKALFEAYQQSNNLDDAIAMGEEITKAEPQNIIINKGLLALYKKQNSDDKMGEQIEAMLALAPNDKGVLTEAADYYAGHGEAEKAIRYYSALVKLDPDDTSIKIALGRLYCMSGEYDQCLELLSDKLASMNSTEQYLTRIYLAYSHLKLSHMQKAIEHLLFLESSTNIELDAVDKTMYAQASYEIGKFEHQQGNLEATVRYVTVASGILPDDTRYKQFLDETQASLAVRGARKRKRNVRNAILSALVVIVIVGGWHFTHGKIVLQLSPDLASSADLIIDGKRSRDHKLIDANTISTATLFIGGHHLEVECSRFRKLDTTVAVRPGNTETVAVILEPILSVLKVTSEPSGAEVYLGGKHVGTTPITVESIQVGGYKVEVKRKFYRRSIRDITIGDRTDKNHHVVLEKGFGTISISQKLIHWGLVDASYRIGSETKTLRGHDLAQFRVEAGVVEIHYTGFAYNRVSQKLRSSWQSFRVEVEDSQHICLEAGFQEGVIGDPYSYLRRCLQ